MGKYTNAINAAKNSDSPEIQKTSEPEKHLSGKPASQTTSKPESQLNEIEEMVNLSIKVPKKLRQQWVAQAKLRGTSLTALITDFLSKELGS